MTPTTHQLKAAPLSFEKTVSSAEQFYEHVEQKVAPDGTVLDQRPKLKNRKARRFDEQIERRKERGKFKAATRLLNKRELRELHLNQFEDSLYRPRHQESKPRKPQTAANSEVPALPLGNTRQGRIARKAEIRRRAQLSEQETLTPQPLEAVTL